MNARVAIRLISLRKGNGLSTEELADELEIPESTVLEWERGETLPDAGHCITLARLYDISLDNLLATDEPVLPQPMPSRSVGAVSKTRKSELQEPHADFNFEFAGMRFRLSRAKFPYPIIVTAFYLFLGFFFRWWHPTWLLFMTIPLYYTMPDFSGGRDPAKEMMKFAYPVLVVMVYLLLGFILNWWHPSWLIFLTIPLYYILLSSVERN